MRRSISLSATVTGISLWGSASTLIGSWGAHVDYDRDGLLDVYWSYQSVGNCLVHNQGNREFTVYRGQSAGRASLHTRGGSCAGDFDDDGWPDLRPAT